MKVIAPYFAADAKGLLKAAIRDPNPVDLPGKRNRLWPQSFPVPKLDDFVLPIGKARIVPPGKDVTIVAYSISVGQALEAAEKLAAEGIDAEVIDLRTLRPLDMDTVLECVKKTNRIVTVEQAWPVCSIGSEICAAWRWRRSTIWTRRPPRCRARTCRCPMPPTWKSWRCRRSMI